MLSGTPTEAGTFPITVKATDARGCTKLQPASLAIAINAPPVANAQSVAATEDTPLPSR